MKRDLIELLTNICENLFERDYSIDEENHDGIRVITIHGEFWCGTYSRATTITEQLEAEAAIVKDVLQTCIGTWLAQCMFKDSYALKFFNVKDFHEQIKGSDKNTTTVSLFANPVSKYFRTYPYQDHLIDMNAIKLSDSGTIDCTIKITVLEKNRLPGLFV